ncbi:MAG: hypothetical protein AAF517_00580 [Planctomycetota bacterium]
MKVRSSIVWIIVAFVVSPEVSADIFRRGDTDASGDLAITDAIGIFRFLFLGDGEAVSCDDAADVDDSGAVNISDGVYLLIHLFQGGRPPVEPLLECGEDPTADEIDCEEFSACEQPVLPTVWLPEGEAPPDSVVLVIDRSASLVPGGWPDRIRTDGAELFRSLPEGTLAGMVFFDVGIVRFPASGQLLALRGDRSAHIDFLQAVAVGGGSCISQGISAGIRMSYSSFGERRILVVTDGGAFCQGRDQAEYLKEMLTIVREANFRDASIHVFGLAPRENAESALRRLAEMNGGEYFRVE